MRKNKKNQAQEEQKPAEQQTVILAPALGTKGYKTNIAAVQAANPEATADQLFAAFELASAGKRYTRASFDKYNVPATVSA